MAVLVVYPSSSFGCVASVVLARPRYRVEFEQQREFQQQQQLEQLAQGVVVLELE